MLTGQMMSPRDKVETEEVVSDAKTRTVTAVCKMIENFCSTVLLWLCLPVARDITLKRKPLMAILIGPSRELLTDASTRQKVSHYSAYFYRTFRF